MVCFDSGTGRVADRADLENGRWGGGGSEADKKDGLGGIDWVCDSIGWDAVGTCGINVGSNGVLGAR